MYAKNIVDVSHRESPFFFLFPAMFSKVFLVPQLLLNLTVIYGRRYALETGPKTMIDLVGYLETWNKLNITITIRNWALINVFNTISNALQWGKPASYCSCNFHTNSESSSYGWWIFPLQPKSLVQAALSLITTFPHHLYLEIFLYSFSSLKNFFWEVKN